MMSLQVFEIKKLYGEMFHRLLFSNTTSLQLLVLVFIRNLYS